MHGARVINSIASATIELQNQIVSKVERSLAGIVRHKYKLNIL